MTETLRLFTSETLFEATSALLKKLNIAFESETAEPIPVSDLFDTEMPKYMANALTLIDATYFIGIANDASLSGEGNEMSMDDIKAEAEKSGKYDGMFIFACDAKRDADIARSDIAALTRGFNRAACACPVIVIVRQAEHITLSTCERMEYTQEWRRNNGEKLGKVSILRDINCKNPHRGHINILESIGEERFDNFEKLYNHWREKFSNELLTKKFYSELSDWYAWAVQIAKFPNDLSTKVDDQKYNHESCIRLITRLIFVWFLKQKHLIPREIFDEGYIRDNFIDNFDPHDRNNMLYDAEKSRYYRLILQNLFFAMLNCPIVAEGKNTPNNRRFMSQKTYHGINPDHNINNIMRYESEFKEGGNKKFLQLANRYVPFLNGGLFDCLDNKSSNIYYDGFSESQKSLDSLYLPDYLFFGEEVGNGIDLSKWYGDAKKKKVSARGIIDILGRYSFTVEENTPLEQEVSLDPELLGKVFENLLAAYNPETQTSARKQTGSFYTPREIVQYMVDESLVAHLKRKCGDRNEELYRSLVSYSADEISMSDEQRNSVIEALYDCRVLDPACGSGAFPMGVLQQMVHVLKKVDPTNELWNKKVVDISIEEARKELLKATEAKDKEQIEKERETRLADIEEAFNNAINYPDYARKLFLIEHCIHGVDIQPIATQISKLRFFISLVVDQKPTDDPKSNFGIRPLPNLESKFVSANTLIPLDREPNLFDSMPEILEYEKQLEELSHRIFLSKRNTEKMRLRDEMDNTRMMMAMALNNNGFLGPDGYSQLVEWNMFDQNSSARFFDPEWMFGVKEGFDIVIGNPPYLRIQGIRETNPEEAEFLSANYESATGSFDLYVCFVERGLKVINESGLVNFIMPIKWSNAAFGSGLRDYISKNKAASKIINFGAYQVFNASTYTALQWFKPESDKLEYVELDRDLTTNTELGSYLGSLDKNSYSSIPCTKLTKETWVLTAGSVNELLDKLNRQPRRISDVFEKIFQGLATGKDDVFFLNNCTYQGNVVSGFSKELNKTVDIEIQITKPLLKGEDVHKYDDIQTNRVVILPYEYVNGNAILTKEDTIKNLYPLCYKYYKQCERVLRNREHGRFDIDGEWFQLSRKQGLNSASIEKLVAPEISLGGNYSYDEEGVYYSTTKIYGYIKNINVAASYKSLMAIMNSKVMWFFMQNTGYVLRGGYYTFKTNYVNPFPIPSDESILQVQPIIEKYVNQILTVKKENREADFSHLEHNINHIVYHLYDLTYDEVLIIDPQTPITREEYDNYRVE